MRLQLSRLRDIGWSLWDPIGLRDTIEGPWKESQVADEYDVYLLQVVSLLRAGHEDAECVAYLEGIEAETMALGLRAGTHQRARNTVHAVKAYLSTLPDGAITFTNLDR